MPASAQQSAAALALDAGANDFLFQWELFVASRVVAGLIEACYMAARLNS